MLKHKLKFSLVACILSTNLFAGSIGSGIGGAVEKGLSNLGDFVNLYQSMFSEKVNPTVQKLILEGLGGNVNVNGLFTDSKLPFELTCDVDKIDFGQLNDMCSAYKTGENAGNNSVNSLLNSFSFGECSVKNNNSGSCRSEEIRKACGFINNPDGKTVFGTTSSNVSNKENMIYTGGDVYLKGNYCEFNKTAASSDKIKYGNKTGKQVQNDYLSPAKIASKSEAGGSSAYWRPGKLSLYETCVKNALSLGKNPEAVCKGEFYALPATKTDVKDQIANTVKTVLKDGSSGMAKKVNDIEGFLKSSANPNCKTVVGGECKDSAYINNVKKPMEAMISGEKADKIKKTEEEMASFQEHVRVSTMPKYEITYPTQEVLNGLHPEQKADFVIASNKQMHQEALFNSSIQNLTELKKELIEISFRKAELSSKTFYPSAAIEEATRIMKSGF